MGITTTSFRIGATLALATCALVVALIGNRSPTPLAPAPAPLDPAFTATTARPPVPPALLTGAPVPATLSQQVDALIASRDPQKAYAAYRLLADCISFNRDGDRLIFDQEEANHWTRDGGMPGFRSMNAAEKRRDTVFCGTLTERMRQSRIDYLALAAQGGLAAAAIEQASVGPFGDRSALATRPDDPLVREWKAQVQQQLARAADVDADLAALSYLSALSLVGNEVVDKNPALAYRYGVAMSLIYRDLNGAENVMAKLYSTDSSLMQDASATLSLQERAFELAEAQRIAAIARSRRQHGQNGQPETALAQPGSF